jgi:hypothetical protein
LLTIPPLPLLLIVFNEAKLPIPKLLPTSKVTGAVPAAKASDWTPEFKAST